jgi:hypothetical protein
MNSMIVVVVMLNSFVLAAAEQITVKRDGAVLRKEKGTVYPVVAKLQKGQTLDVLQRADKGWLMAESEGKRGWAHDDWLKEPATGLGKLTRGAEVLATGDAQAAAARDAAANRGVTEVTRQIALKKNYSQATIDQLDSLMKMRDDVINSGGWETFAREGKVGPPAARG